MKNNNKTNIKPNVYVGGGNQLFSLADIIYQLNSDLDTIINMNTASKVKAVVDDATAVQTGVVNIVNILNLIDEYINSNMHRLEGFEYLAKMFLYFGNGLNDIKTKIASIDLGNTTDALAGNIIELISGMRYISSIVATSQNDIENAFDALIGDVSSYKYLNGSNADFDKDWDNNSLLFKFFMINVVINKIMGTMTNKGIIKAMWFWKVTMRIKMFLLKTVIKSLANTARSIRVYTADTPNDFSQIAQNILTGFTTFRAVISNVTQQELGLRDVLKLRFRVWKLMKVYKYFIKKLLNISNEARDIIERGSIDYISSMVDSVFKIIQSLDIFKHFGVVSLWRNVRKVKRTFKSILSIPIAIVKKYDKKEVSIDKANEILGGIVNMIEVIINLNNEVNTSPFNGKKIKKLKNVIITILDIIDKFKNIEQDKIGGASNNLSEIQDILGQLQDMMKKSVEILSAGIIFNTMLPKMVGALIKMITRLNDAPRITKKAKKQFLETLELLDSMIGTVTKIGAAMTAMVIISPMMLLGMTAAVTMLVSLVFSMVLISKIIKKYKKDIRATQKELVAIMGTISAFITAIAALGLAGVSLVSLGMVIGILWLVSGQFFAISAFLKKKKRIIATGGKMLMSIGASMIGAVGSLALVNQKTTPKFLTTVLLLGAIVAEIVGIFILLTFVKKPVKKGVKMLLWMVLSVTGVYVAILTLAALTSVAMISVALITLAVSTFVTGSLLLFLTVYRVRKKAMMGAALTLVITATFAAMGLLVGEIYAAISDITNWEAFGFLFANATAMVVATAAAGLMTKVVGMGVIGFGLITLLSSATVFTVVGLLTGKIYEAITNVNWEAFGFLFANAAAMVAAVVLAGFVTKAVGMGTIGQGLLTLVAVAVSFMVVGKMLGMIYESIGGITDWAAFGFLFANIGAMTLTAAAVGLILVYTGGIGAAAIVIGCATLIVIAGSFALVALCIGSMYKQLKDLNSDKVTEAIGLLVDVIESMVVGLVEAGGRIVRKLSGKEEGGSKNTGFFGKVLNSLGLDFYSAIAQIVGGMTILYCTMFIVGALLVISWLLKKLLGNIKDIGPNMKHITDTVGILINSISDIITTISNADLHFDKTEKDDGIITKICRHILPKSMMDIAAGITIFGKMAELMAVLGVISLVAMSADKTLSILSKYDKAPKGMSQKVHNLMTAVMEAAKALNGMDADDNLNDVVDNASKYQKVIKETDKLINKVNGLNLDKMKAFAEMWKQAAAFSHSINGNFDNLASAISEKLAPVLKELKEAIENADKTIKERTKQAEKANNTTIQNTTNQNVPGSINNNTVHQNTPNPTPASQITGKSPTQTAQAKRIAELNKKHKIEECITQAQGGYALNVKIIN